MMSPPTLSPHDIQQHIYSSLIHARTPDVVLDVSGTWNARYKLHRIVLIQSGFFSSLFTAGFLESTDSSGLQHVDVVFDDRNITRPAFEVCIARLYGGGPPLHVSSALIPSSLQPLTPSFPGPPPPSVLPRGHHPATPSFLLSLLATSIYLSIPSLASQALTLILTTVGPYTVIQYLQFATGFPLDFPAEQDPDAAVGLEHIAEILKPSSPSPSDSHDLLTDKLHDLDVHKEDPAESDSELERTEPPRTSPSFNYGAVSDKIGEAAACWLARWGPDMLLHEERTSRVKDLPLAPTPTQPSVSRRRADTMPSRPSTDEPSLATPHRVPLIWARGGLTSAWIRELVSSDVLFVKDERERYDLARTIVELRRGQGIDDDEEKDWEIMFRHGVYYTNMLVDDIIAISQDMSPTTGRPFVPISVLQDAHWTQSLLRCRIIARPRNNSSPTSSPSPASEKELGLCVTTAEILSRLSDSPKQQSAINDKDKMYYLVAQDSSLRIGDSNGIEGASMDQLFDLSVPSTDNKSPARVATSETNFFGLRAEQKTAVECVASDATGKARWSSYPPCRFAVEFWDIDSLKEKSRLHSHTIWYAGNLFNVYVQVVRKKGIQLGIYLHRQSSIDPIPARSAPVQTTTRGERNHNRVPSFPQQLLSSVSSPTVRHSPSMQPIRSATPNSSPPPTVSPHTYQSTGNAIPATAPPISPVQPYRDPRPAVSAYFSISCTSTTGSSITRFTSVPDVFSVSQSWGWKSSSLRPEEMGEVGADGQPVKSPVPAPRALSLRATVVLGVV